MAYRSMIEMEHSDWLMSWQCSLTDLLMKGAQLSREKVGRFCRNFSWSLAKAELVNVELRNLGWMLTRSTCLFPNCLLRAQSLLAELEKEICLRLCWPRRPPCIQCIWLQSLLVGQKIDFWNSQSHLTWPRRKDLASSSSFKKETQEKHGEKK